MTDEQVDGRTKRWAGHREARRLELVDAAVAAIAEHGPEVTTEQIAARAGVSRPGLYRHFEGRDDLQGAIAARSVERLVADLEPVWRPSGRPFAMLSAALRSHLNWLAANANVYRYLKRTSEPATANVRVTVSAHVACLRDCGLVEGRPQGRQVFYSLARPELTDVLAAAETLLAATGNAVVLCPNYGTDATTSCCTTGDTKAGVRR